jgi:hypothetical protein
LLALRVASVATFALFQVLLPTLFSLLTVVAGRRMAERSERMIAIGRAGQRGLSRASEQVRYQFLGGATPEELQGPTLRQRVSIDADAEELELEDEHASTEPPKRSTR